VVFGRDRFLIPAMLLITLVLTLLRSREEGRKVLYMVLTQMVFG
jgi:hypothetical protein